jgi:quinohemoprotein ethanol dehydrogenase
MAVSPRTGLVYIPAIEESTKYWDDDMDLKTWKRPPYYAFNGGVAVAMEPKSSASLIAWDPIKQQKIWSVPRAANVSGGVVATAGDLVFEGDVDNSFRAYDAKNGKIVWSFDAKAPVMAPPISYEVDGKQYVTVLTGTGTSLVVLGEALEKFGIDYRTQKRRVLTFALDGKVQLPNSPTYEFVPVQDADFHPDPAAEKKGAAVFGQTCLICHGYGGFAAGVAPDLRASPAILSPETFKNIVHDGALVDQNMPLFDRIPDDEREGVRQYIRKLAHDAAQKEKGKNLGQ